MGDTKIEWTDAVWNPVTGCTKVSQGCKNCYAERIFHRPYPGRPFTDVQCHPDRLDQPMRWKKPRMVFVNSISDLFHEDIPDEFIDKVFAVMALCPRHTFQILTKRPERMLNTFMRWSLVDGGGIADAAFNLFGTTGQHGERLFPPTGWPLPDWPLPNVWMGVSVEDQATADERIPLLLQTPAAVRWVSAEPLLGPVDLDPLWLRPSVSAAYLAGKVTPDMPAWTRVGASTLNWIVVGGESGPRARPMHPGWVRSLRDQCRVAGVPFFFKQWGEWSPADSFGEVQYTEADVYCFQRDVPPLSELYEGCVVRRIGKKAAGRTLDGRTWDEYPDANEKGTTDG